MKRLKDWMLAMWALLPLCGLGQQWVSSRESTTALRTVVAGDFGFLAGGGPSAEPLIRSPDGVQWTKVPLGTTRTIQSITAGVGPGNQPYFVAVDHAGGILRSASPSGPWGQVAQTRSGLSRVASLGSLVVACGADGLLVESLDGGTTWKEVVSPVPGKSWRFLVADEGAHPENVLWAQFLVVAEDGSAGCRDSTGRWVSLASLGSIVPITGVEWFGDYFWVFSGQSPVGWSGRFIAENMPIGLWTAHVLPSFQSTARYRAVAALGDQAYAFGDSGLFRYGPLAGFPGLENILLLGESVGNFTGSDSGRWGVAAVTDAGYVFRLGTNSPPKPEITVTIRPTRTRLSEGEVLFLDLDIVASSKVARSVQWRINGQPVAGNDPRVPGASTWYLKLSVTVADSGVYQAEVEFTDGTRVNTGAGVDIRVGPRPPLEWSSVSVPGGFSNALTGLAVTEDRWLMGGGFGLVVRTNGNSWSRAAGIDQPVYWLEKVNGTCFALGVSLIARSEDGLVWKSGVGVGGQPFGGDFYGLLPWSGGYLAFGATLAGGGMAWTSIDGLTWAPDLRFAGGAPWYGGATDGRNLVLAGTRGSILRVLFDGSIQKSSIASGEDIFSLAFFGGRFLGVTSTGRIWTSTEGLTWTLQKDLSFDGFVFRKTGGLLFVLGSNGPGVFWSSDGVQWQQGGWIGSAPDPIFMDVLLVSGSYRLLGPEGIVGASQNLGDVEVPVLVPPNIRQPTAGSSIARIEIPALWSERVQLEWWLDGALIPGATGPVVEISTSGWLKEGQVWAGARWWNGSVPVGPFRIVPQRQDPLQVSLNTPGGRLPLGSDLRVNVRGLQGSGLVRIRVSIDANEDGQRQPDEPVVESFLVRDGGVPTLGGVRDGARPGDEDGLVNGGVDCLIRWSLPTEFEALPLPYLVECEIPGSAVNRVVASFRPEDRKESQGVEGVMLDSRTGLPLPSTVVVVAQVAGLGEGFQVVSAALTDRQGRYRVVCPPGGFWVLPLRDGYVTPMDAIEILDGSSDGDCLVLPGRFTSRDVRLNAATATVGGTATFLDGAALDGEELVMLMSRSGLSVGRIGPGGAWDSRVTAGDWLVYHPMLSGGRLGRIAFIAGLAQSKAFSVGAAGQLLDARLRFQRAERVLSVAVTGPDSRPLPGVLVFVIPKNYTAGDYENDGPWSAWARTGPDGIASIALAQKDQWVGGFLVDGGQWFAADDITRFVGADAQVTRVTLPMKPTPRPGGFIRFLEIQQVCCGSPRTMIFGASFEMEFEVQASVNMVDWVVVGSGSTSGQMGTVADGDAVLFDKRFYRIRRRGAPAPGVGYPQVW